MAQLVLGIAGAAVGSVIGGPMGAQIGFALGSAAGASLQTNRTYGPRLSDLKAPQAAYGSVIPYVEGSIRTAGVWAWVSDKREVANTESAGGKGGPTVENVSYTYFCDAIILLSDSPIAGVRRVWSNGKLIWSATEDATLETLLASEETTGWDAMRVYTGSSTQMPDPVYEAAVGTANAPAYRGRGYVFIENMALGTSGQIPALTFEVYVGEVRVLGEIQAPVVTQSRPGTIGVGTAAFVDNGVLQVAIPQWTTSYTNTNVNVYEMDVLEGTSTQVGTYTVVSNGINIASTGYSDVPVLCQMQSTTLRAYFGQTGGLSTFNAPSGSVGSQGVFCCVGSDIVFSGRDASPARVYRYAKSGGAVLATSPTLAAGPSSMVIVGEHVYVAGSGSETMFKLLLSDLSLVATIQTPIFGGANNDSIPMLTVFDGQPCWCSSATPSGNTYPVWVWGGTAWQQIGNLDSYFGQGQFNTPSLLVAGSVMLGARTEDSPTRRYDVRYATILGERVDPSLQAVVTRQCARAGLAADKIDVTQLSGDVHGFAVSQLSSARQILEMLGTAYTFLTVESGGKLCFRPRGGASVATIPYADLAASDLGDIEPLPLVRANDLEVPAQVVVKFANWDNDHQDGAEVTDRLLSSLAGSVETIELPMALTPTEARRIADIRTAEVVGSALRVEGLAVDKSYARLEPGDPITIVDSDGTSTYRVVIMRIKDTGVVRVIDGVLEDASAVVSSAATDDDYPSSDQLERRAETQTALMDIPILTDADDDTGHYAAASRTTNTGAWPGAYLLRGQNDADYAQVAAFSARTYIGNTTAALGNFTGGRVFDEVNTLQVTGSGTLESYTRDNILTGNARPLLVGDEVVFYRDATLVSPGVYTVRGLVRGARGTEWAIAGHGTTDRVVLLTTGVVRVQTPTSKVGVQMDFKGVTNGVAADTVVAQQFTNTAVGKRPFSPVDARFSRSASGTIVASWKRRTRLSARFVGTAGASIPLGEDTEAYDVEVLRGSPLAVIATIPSSTASVDLSSASAALTLASPIERLVRRGDGSIVGLDWTDPSFLVAVSSTGAFLARSSYFGSDVMEFATSTTTVYVAVRQSNGAGGWESGRLRSVPLAAITTALDNPPAANHTTAVAGDIGGVAWDGLNPWSVGTLTGYLRRHNATTLAVELEIPVQLPIAPLTDAYLRHVASLPAVGSPGEGLLFTMCGGGPASGDVVAVDPTGSPTQRWRVNVPGAGRASGNPPLQVIGADRLLVPTDSGWVLLNAFTGATIASSISGEQVPVRAALSGTQFVVRRSAAELSVALVRSAVDGSLVRTVSGLGAGSVVGTLEGQIVQRRLTPAGTYVLGAAEVAAGDVVRIYQVSATYGRGKPLQATVPNV